MLETLLGSLNAERVLFFILKRKEGYAREISRYYETDLDPIQKQLEKFELGSILVSKSVGRTRLYSFNPAYPFLQELLVLLEKAFSFLPEEEKEKLTIIRKRPRRSKKPL